ncbi:hemolysin family protein [Afifella pfennigii]|uniref:hemolysin family protein n=1 Tax=Afifella pfennigii TaxID=209897 RepID=UPI00047A8877|nr:hemolysin family protein [Afifella pfennigii]
MVWQLLIVLFLILLNGFFAMSELAIVSSRAVRLRQMAEGGSRGARTALRLLEDSTGFLSSVQIGITLVGIFAGAYGGSVFAAPLAEGLERLSFPAQAADEIAFVLVVVAITYLSLIIGELVPKRIALTHAERIAALVARPMRLLSLLAAPVVWFLRLSTEGMLRLLGVRASGDSHITEEEVKALIAEGAEAGVFVPAERDMINGVLRLADRTVRSVMVPRTMTVTLSLDQDLDRVLSIMRESGHSRYPVSGQDVDDLAGFVHVKDVLPAAPGEAPAELATVLQQPLYVAETLSVLRLLELFRSSGTHLAVVVDEYGSFEGIVTPNDILTAIAGDLPEHPGDDEPDAVQREDGSWLLDGAIPVDRLQDVLGTSVEPKATFATLAGLVLNELQHIPKPGESLRWQGWVLEVVDLDGRRIDKVLARRAEPAPEAAPQEG